MGQSLKSLWSCVGRRIAPVVLLGGALLGSASALAAPEPDPVPRRWELDAKMGPLRVVTMSVNGSPRAFYYMTYRVTNNSGEDLLFAPAFHLATDQGELLRSGRGVPLAVTDALIESQQNPLLEDQISIIDQLPQGPENAVQGLVAWPANDFDIDELTVYVAGLSGETKTVARPDNGEPVILRKTMMIRYPVPGTLEGRGSRPLKPNQQRWILR